LGTVTPKRHGTAAASGSSSLVSVSRGPKQLEATLKWPIEVLWERPRRVASARLAADRVARGPRAGRLTLIADVKTSYVEYALAPDGLRLADQSVAELEQITTQRSIRLDIDEEIDVALLMIIAAGNRAEYPDIARHMTSRRIEDFAVVPTRRPERHGSQSRLGFAGASGARLGYR
jgi:outer membrane protein TolC